MCLCHFRYADTLASAPGQAAATARAAACPQHAWPLLHKGASQQQPAAALHVRLTVIRKQLVHACMALSSISLAAAQLPITAHATVIAMMLLKPCRSQRDLSIILSRMQRITTAEMLRIATCLSRSSQEHSPFVLQITSLMAEILALSPVLVSQLMGSTRVHKAV